MRRSKRLVSSLAIFLFVAFATSVASAQTKLPADLTEKIDKVANDTFARTGVPRASVAIVKDGQMVYVKAYGDARLVPKHELCMLIHWRLSLFNVSLQAR